MIHTLAILVLTVLLAATVVIGITVVRGRTASGTYGIWLFRLGFLLLSALIILHNITGDATPLSGPGDYLLWLTWAIGFVYIILQLDLPVVAFTVAVSALVFFVSSSYLVHQNNVAMNGEDYQPLLIVLHVVPALIAEVCLVFVLALGVAFTIQERRLKKKTAAVLSGSAPSLDRLQTLHARMIRFGFFSMTVALLTGVAWAILTGRRLLTGDVTQWGAVLAWLILAAALHFEYARGYSIRSLVRFTVIAVAAFLALYLCFQLAAGGRHSNVSLVVRSVRFFTLGNEALVHDVH